VSGMRRVIVGVSGSPDSIAALRYAIGLVRRGDTPLVVVHAWTPPGGDLADHRAPSEQLRRAWKEAASHRLRDALASVFGHTTGGIRVRAVVARGPAAQVLVDLADSPDDLLVVGAGRRGAVERLWRGRVARYCLAHAACPVVAVPPATPPPGMRLGLRTWSFRHRQLTADDVMRELQKLGPAGP